jgi:hypothetical protein
VGILRLLVKEMMNKRRKAVVFLNMISLMIKMNSFGLAFVIFIIVIFIGGVTIAAPIDEGFIGSDEYIDISDYPEYCTAYAISEYCTQEDFNALWEEIRKGNESEYRIHSLAIPAGASYESVIEVSSIEVVADIGRTNKVSARYVLNNPLGRKANTTISFLGISNQTVYLNGDEQADDFFIFAEFWANEAKELVLEYEEESWGDLFAYNANLYLDFRPFLKPVSEGTYIFLLPSDVKIEFCMPGFYSTDSLGRPQVTWERENFIPLTNPFNDLICTWNQGLYPGATLEDEGEIEDWSWLYVIIIIACICGVLFYLQKKDILVIYKGD